MSDYRLDRTAFKAQTAKDAASHSVYFEEDGLSRRTIHLNDLISAKKASGRHKDLDDLDNLSKSED